MAEPTDDYNVLQYQALRVEVDYLTKVLLRLQSISITAIPLVIGAGARFDIDFVLLASPVITVSYVLILLFVQNSIMRAGEYMKTHLEPRLANENELGWEAWLEKYPENRTAERFFAWSAHVAFSLYYIGGTILAHRVLAGLRSSSEAYLLDGFYAGLFVVMLFILIKNLRTQTSGKGAVPNDLFQSK